MPSKSSGVIAADAVVTAAPAVLKSVTILADAANAATVILYDNASAASGTALAKLYVLANTASSTEEFDVQAANGIYADVTGGGINVIVHFTPGWGDG